MSQTKDRFIGKLKAEVDNTIPDGRYRWKSSNSERWEWDIKVLRLYNFRTEMDTEVVFLCNIDTMNVVEGYFSQCKDVANALDCKCEACVCY